MFQKKRGEGDWESLSRKWPIKKNEKKRDKKKKNGWENNGGATRPPPTRNGQSEGEENQNQCGIEGGGVMGS